MHLRPALLLVLFFTATGCLVGRDLTLIEAEPQVSNIEAAPNGDGGSTSGDPGLPTEGKGKPSSSSSSSTGGTSSGDPVKPKDGGADADVREDAGPGNPNPLACPPFGKQEIEPNSVQLQSMAIVKGDTCGKLNVAGDEDWFTYDTGDAGGFLRLKFVGEEDATAVVNNGGLTFTGKTLDLNFFSQGRWYIRIYSPSRATPSYVLTRVL